jgi:hypothetical protein
MIQSTANELNGNAVLKFAIGAPGFKDGPHPTVPDFTLNTVWPDMTADH